MKYFLSILFISICLISFSQEDIIVLSKVDKTVAVFPFNTKLYYNDLDKQIAKDKYLSFDQILNSFRIEFDNSIINSLNDTCTAISLLNSYTISGDNLLEELYSNSNYIYSFAMDFEDDKKSLYNKSKITISDKQKVKTEKKANKKHGGEIVSPIVDNTNKFLHVSFNNKNTIKYLSEKTNSDYLLFINQFEIIGNYTSPYDVERYRNKMLIKVHYSIYSFTGKYIFGSFASTEFPSYITDIEEIKDEYFSLINKQIIKNIPLEHSIKIK